MKKRAKRIAAVSFAVFLIVALVGCFATQEENITDSSFFAMNTYLSITLYDSGGQDIIDAAKEQIRHLESLWSATDEDSEIYQANHSNGQSVTVSEETGDLLSFALKMAEETNGALDPTIYPVMSAWGFTTDQKQVPLQAELERLLALVDYTKISQNGNTLTVPNGMQLDLGSVGKGYAADLTAELLRKQGVKSAVLSFGGNIHVIGSRPNGTDWRIAIHAPWEDEYCGVLEISNAAIVTSGGYENYFEDQKGNAYWHILNPQTGYPADSGLLSVTIISEEGKLCDALSTALFVMGAEEAEAFWREHGGFEMLLVTDDHEILITEGIARQFTLSEGRTEKIRVIRP